MQPLLRSCVCTQAHLESESFRKWATILPPVRPQVIRAAPHLDRKLWEWCYIAQALEERGMLTRGKSGLGFAVGTEPLPALFAGRGCTIVATDQATDEATRQGWSRTNQHAACLESLDKPSLCPTDELVERVNFRVADMNRIPADLRGFDFVWSACSFEHLGDISRGLTFLINMMDCLKPGGVAVHTTEYNVSSNKETVARGSFVIFRRKDLEKIARQLTSLGHHVDLDFRAGDGEADRAVDNPPYTYSPHVKLRLGGFTATSFGLIITKGLNPVSSTRLNAIKMGYALSALSQGIAPGAAVRRLARTAVSATRRLRSLLLNPSRP